jgi:hypothetical protein
MEDNLKMFKVKYLNKYWLHRTQISNRSLGDQTKIRNILKWRHSLMEDNLQILKVEYLSNHWLDLP